MCVQHKVKVTKLTRILLTNLDSSCVSGLPGLIMTMADGGRAEGHVVGPPGLKAFERAVRPFMHRNFFALRMDEVVGEALTFPDSVTVTAAAVHSPTSPQAPAEPAEEPADHAASPVKRRRIESPSSEPSSAPLSVPSSASAPFVPLGHAPGSLPACDVSYVFAVPAQRGRFDAASADALGVPAGRLRGQLHAGRPITLDNGTVILPAQVVGETRPAQAVAVLFCSDLAMLPGLASHCAVAALLGPEPNATVPLVVHLAPGHVADSAPYRAFLAAFGPLTRHWLAAHTAHPPESAPSTAPSTAPPLFGGRVEGSEVRPRDASWLAAAHLAAASPFRRAVVNEARLQRILPELFPSADRDLFETAVEALPATATGVLPLLRFQVLPDRGFGETWAAVEGSRATASELAKEVGLWGAITDLAGPLAAFREAATATNKAVARVAASTTVDSFREVPSVASAVGSEAPLERLASAVGESVGESEDPSEDDAAARLASAAGVQLTFLGTGSSCPSKHRNMSAILLELGTGAGACAPTGGDGKSSSPLQPPPTAALLMDCGEGTLGQMRRLWGHAGSSAKLAAIAAVWISHPHADHHLGLIELLAARRQARDAARVAARDAEADGSPEAAASAQAPEGPEGPVGPEEDHPVVVIGPNSVGGWLAQCARHHPRDVGSRQVVFVPCASLLPHLAPNLAVVESPWQTMGAAAASLAPSPSPPPSSLSAGDDLRYLAAGPGDVALDCRDCAEKFLFTAGEQAFYAAKGFSHPPSRCGDCRALHKAERDDAVGPGPTSGAIEVETKRPGEGEAREAATPPVSGAASAATAVELVACLRRLGLNRLANVRVTHCREAFGLRVDAAAGWSLVYSGDCRPSDALAELGRGASVLVHEATFGDAMLAQAAEKRHSTVGEAVEMAARMAAHRCVLTHFSQRYPTLPVLPPHLSSRVLVALDLLSVPLPHLAWAPAALPVLRALFPDDPEEDHDDSAGGNDDGAVAASKI